MTIKAVLFDLDETLLDRTRSLELFLTWEAAEYLNLPLEQCDQYIERFIELDNNGQGKKTDVYTTLWKEYGLFEHTADDLAQHYDEDFDRFCCEKRHAASALEMLRSHGYRLAVVSNGRSPFQENKLNALQIENLFDTVVVSEAVNARKPDASIFLLTCERLGVSPEQCVFVGDNPQADIEGANNVGMFSVFVPTRRYPACAQADRVCRDMRDLPAMVIEASGGPAA